MSKSPHRRRREMLEHGVLSKTRGDYLEGAPLEPQYRARRSAPAPQVTLEEAAMQLASDPEFKLWAGQEYAAELAGKARRAALERNASDRRT
jgi:hypothetical protein